MSNTVEIVETQSLLSTAQTIETVVVVQTPAPEIVEVVAVGPQGIQGPPGNDASFLLGVPIAFTDGQPDDLLSFTGSVWRNKPQAQVTDGGNF